MFRYTEPVSYTHLVIKKHPNYGSNEYRRAQKCKMEILHHIRCYITDHCLMRQHFEDVYKRQVQVEIKLKQNIGDFLDLSVFAHFLEKDMTEKSVCNSSYKIVFV